MPTTERPTRAHSHVGGQAGAQPSLYNPRPFRGSEPVHAEHWVSMRTTNGVERLNKEIKLRTRAATLFPNPASCLRLVSAILAEQDEEWMNAKIDLNMKP